MLFRPMRMLADRFNTLQMGIVAGERIFHMLDRKDTISDTGEIEVERLDGAMEFKDVYFSYDGKHDVLKNINFEVEPDETLAVVGGAGCGITRIINMLNHL